MFTPALQARSDDDASWKARIPAQFHVGAAAPIAAEFEVACRDGKGGALTWSLIIADPDALKTFPLTDFEGPSGIGEKRTLAQWSLGAANGAHAGSPISGWYGVDGDGFVLATSRLSSKPSDLARLSRALIETDQAEVHLVLQPPTPKGDALIAQAEVGDHREAIAKIVKPCLTTVK
jgi:hypothetical protein